MDFLASYVIMLGVVYGTSSHKKWSLIPHLPVQIFTWFFSLGALYHLYYWHLCTSSQDVCGNGGLHCSRVFVDFRENARKRVMHCPLVLFPSTNTFMRIYGFSHKLTMPSGDFCNCILYFLFCKLLAITLLPS